MATRMFDRRDRASGMLARHGDLLGRVARQYSLCADDAEDAVQRGFEIYLRRVESLDPATELAWLKVVVKHEALAVRRARSGVAGEQVDLDAVPAVAQRSVEERLESAERVARSAEVMRRLKRDEARALMLKAEGLSYVEIGERLGWTYTNIKCPLGPSARSLQSACSPVQSTCARRRRGSRRSTLRSGYAGLDAWSACRPTRPPQQRVRGSQECRNHARLSRKGFGDSGEE